MEIGSRNQIQNKGFHNKVFNEYEELQDLIRKEAGINCSIKVKPNCVSIRTKDYPDFVIAKSIIKGRVSKEVVRDCEPL